MRVFLRIVMQTIKQSNGDFWRNKLLPLQPSNLSSSYLSVDAEPRTELAPIDQLTVAGKIVDQNRKVNCPCPDLGALYNSMLTLGHCLWDYFCVIAPPRLATSPTVDATTALLSGQHAALDEQSLQAADCKLLGPPLSLRHWNQFDPVGSGQFSVQDGPGRATPVHMAAKTSTVNLSFAMDIPESERIQTP